MKAFKMLLAGGATVAALTAAAPASAQVFPGYGYGGGDIIGQVIGSVIGGGYGYSSSYGSPYGYGSPSGYGSPYGYDSLYGSGYGNQGYGQSSQYAIGQCMGAVQQRLQATYDNRNGYGARVLGVSDVQPRNNGGMIVSGVANSGRTAAGYGYDAQPPVDLTFTCKTNRSGFISSIEVGQANLAYGNVAPVYSPYGTDYSQYGYRRY